MEVDIAREPKIGGFVGIEFGVLKYLVLTKNCQVLDLKTRAVIDCPLQHSIWQWKHPEIFRWYENGN